jgi:hypothetical protein
MDRKQPLPSCAPARCVLNQETNGRGSDEGNALHPVAPDEIVSPHPHGWGWRNVR